MYVLSMGAEMKTGSCSMISRARLEMLAKSAAFVMALDVGCFLTELNKADVAVFSVEALVALSVVSFFDESIRAICSYSPRACEIISSLGTPVC